MLCSDRRDTSRHTSTLAFAALAILAPIGCAQGSNY